MLEKAIIDSGVATGLDLGLSKTSNTENDGESSGRQSFSTLASDLDAALDLDLQNSTSWDFDPNPDSLDENNFFASQDFFENWNQHDLALDQETSPLPFIPDLNQPLQLGDLGSSGPSHRHILPWREPSISETQSDILRRKPLNASTETGTHSPDSRKGISSFVTIKHPIKETTVNTRWERGKTSTAVHEMYPSDSHIDQEISNGTEESTGSEREDHSILERGEQTPKGAEHGIGDDV